MSYIPSKAMPHASKHKPAPDAASADASANVPEPSWRAGVSRAKSLLNTRSGKLGLLGAATAAVLVPLALARSTAKR